MERNVIRAKKTALALSFALAGGLAGSLASTPAAAQVVIVAPTAPPPLRMEAMPAPRPDAVWVRGHWRWDGRGYVWVNGHWRPVEPGYSHRRYMDGGWVQTSRGWEWREGGWR